MGRTAVQVQAGGGVSGRAEPEADPKAAAAAFGETVQALDGARGWRHGIRAGRQDRRQPIADAGGDAAVARLQQAQGPNLGGDGAGKADAVLLGVGRGDQLLDRDGVGAHRLDHRTARIGAAGRRPRGQQFGQGVKQLARLGLLGVGEHRHGGAGAVGKLEGDTVAVAASAARHADGQRVGAGYGRAGRCGLGFEAARGAAGQTCRGVHGRLQPQAVAPGRAGQGQHLAGQGIDQPHHKAGAAAATHLHVGAAQQLLERRLQVGGKGAVAQWGSGQIDAVGTGAAAAVAEAVTALAEAVARGAEGRQPVLGGAAALHLQADLDAAPHPAGKSGQLKGAAAAVAAGGDGVGLAQVGGGTGIGRCLQLQILQRFTAETAAQLQREAGATAARDADVAAAVELLKGQIEGAG